MPPPEATDWIDVRGGWFFMGGGQRDNENPRHRVWVSPFRLARTQVTRAEYQRFLDNTGRTAAPFWGETRFGDPRMPAVGPSWHDATAFCDWTADSSGEPVRLPTEAEWEFAAKADREVLYPWGDTPPESIADYHRRWLDAPEPVDAFPSTHPWSFLGLGENVHEWCADWYEADYYQRSTERDPRGPASGVRRSARGGSWRHRVRVSRCAARSAIRPEFQYSDFGFRLACDPHGEDDGHAENPS